ncbi:MAG: hypothetical protein MPN21_12820 [Thermoanaerobaculia bacterium]|nr:hypothetical protein [Thermoanaerobaculia bacterium]
MKFLTSKNAFWPVLLALLTEISYVVISTTVPVNQHVPWIWMILLLVAVVWSAVLVREKTSVLRFAGLLSTLASAALFSWWTLSFSAYENQTASVSDGNRVAELVGVSLRDHAGFEEPILSSDGPTLLVLYRGHW